jgi:hypothetical protein
MLVVTISVEGVRRLGVKVGDGDGTKRKQVTILKEVQYNILINHLKSNIVKNSQKYMVRK